MKSQKIKQWIRDYLDFAMPLIMMFSAYYIMETFVFGKIVDLFDYYFDLYYKDVLNGIKGTFMTLFIEGKYFIWLSIIVIISLIIRLFTTNLKINLGAPLSLVLFICIPNYEFAMRGGSRAFFTLFTDFIIFFVMICIFVILKLFFANYPKLKNITYITITIFVLLTVISFITNILYITFIPIDMRIIITRIVAIYYVFIFIMAIICCSAGRCQNMPQDLKEAGFGGINHPANKKVK